MNRIAWALASLLVLAGAGGIAFFFVSTRPEAAEIERERPRIAVEVLRARPSDNPVTVTAMGEVQAAHQLVLQPEISGRVVARADNLVPGGLVERGEGLVRIDGRDLKAVIAAQEAAVAQAKVQLADERGRKQVAASDWEGRVDDLNDHAKQFALREPHIESAQASLGSSKTQLTKARRDLSRSRVQAPFDALVIDAPVELGQVVSPQVKLATLVAVDRYWVQVSVPVSHLEFLAIPGVNTKSDGGSRAQVVHNSGGVFIERPGHVEQPRIGVRVHRQFERTVPHRRLCDARGNAALGQVRRKRVPKRVDIKRSAPVVRLRDPGRFQIAIEGANEPRRNVK